MAEEQIEYGDRKQELRRAYRRLLCADDEPFKDYALTVLADLLGRCGVLSNNYQAGGTAGDVGYLAGRQSIGAEILQNLGMTDLRKITEALTTVLPKEIIHQTEAENE